MKEIARKTWLVVGASVHSLLYWRVLEIKDICVGLGKYLEEFDYVWAIITWKSLTMFG